MVTATTDRGGVGLLAQPDFLRLWGGLTLSLLGGQVSSVALPLTAAVWLGASPFEMGLIGALRWAPYLLFGLLAGVWLDRTRRRPVLVATHLARALLLGLVPSAAALGWLRIEQLYLTAFGVGALMLFSDVAYQSVLPGLVARDRLVEANARAEQSRAVAQIVGPSAGGALVQLLTAPFALAFDALAFALGALLIGSIGQAEPARQSAAGRDVRGEIAEGLRWVFGHPLLRSIQATSMTFIGANSVWSAVYVLYLTGERGFDAFTIGLLTAAGGPTAVLGASLTGRIVGRIGVGRSILACYAIGGGATLLLPLSAAVPSGLALGLLFAAHLAFGFGLAIGSPELALRQSVTPARLLGRTNATMRSLNWSTVTVGSLVGGALGGALGLVPTMALGAALSAGSCLVLLRSPIVRVGALDREPPSA
jgi:predicted MFS family arabinose efflux permease